MGDRAPLLALAVAPLLAACEPEPLTCPAGFASDGAACLEEAPAPLSVFLGDVEISSPEEAEAFCEDHNAIGGSLRVWQGPADLSGLSCLQQVAGDVLIEDITGLRNASLPRLAYIGGDLSLQVLPDLIGADFPRLQLIDGSLAVQFLAALPALRMPALEAVGRYVSIYQCAQLQAVDLPRLVATGGPVERDDAVFYLRINRSLRRFSAPRLESVATVLKVSSNNALEQIELDSLNWTGQGLYLSFNSALAEVELPIQRVGGFFFIDRTELQSVRLPELAEVGRQFAILHNHHLRSVQAPRLRRIGLELQVEDNPLWAAQDIEAFVDGVGQENIEGGVRLVGNGD